MFSGVYCFGRIHTQRDYKQQCASELGRHRATDHVITPIAGSIVTSFLSTSMSSPPARESMGHRALSVKINEAGNGYVSVLGIYSIFTKSS